MSESKSGKIEKITDTLWRFWWFALFFLILPFGIAGITAFTINRVFASQISTIPKGEIEVEKPDPALDTDEIEAWEKLFNERDDPDSQP